MSNIVSNPEDYFRQLIPARDALLLELEAESHREQIPIVGPLVGELLFLLVRATRARRILELGTATGYSGVYLARACEPLNGHLVTVENNATMAARARNNFRKAGLEERIEIRVGDALAEMAQMKAKFDLIFMDIDKGDYLHALPYCGKLLKKNGLLVADNVGFQDAGAFNQTIARHPLWTSVALYAFLPSHSPEKDGLCLAVRH
jgi:predicted O-methyltransferase YrrM